MTHWLDSVFAVPVIGLQWRLDLELCSRWSEGLGRWMHAHDSDEDPITLIHDRPLEWDFRFRSGFSCAVRPSTLSVRFSFPLSIEPAYPVAQVSLGEIRPYTVRLEEVERLVLGLMRELAGAKMLTRIGVMTLVRIPVDQLPPGALGLIGHLSSPWKLGLEAIDAKMTAILDQDRLARVRCHHMLKFNRLEGEKVADLALDWQHLFEEPRDLTAENLEELVRLDKVRALDYFQAFAEGNFGNGS